MNTVELLALIFGITTGIFAVVTLLQNRIDQIRDKIQASKVELKTEIQASKAELKAEIQTSTVELKTGMQELRTEMQAIETRLCARLDRLTNIMGIILISLTGSQK